MHIQKNKEQIVAEVLNFQVTTSILDHVSDYVWVKNIEGVYGAVSESLAKRLNLASDSMIGKTDYDLYATELADTYVKNDRLVIEKRETIVFQEYDIIVGGEKRFFEVSKSPIYDVSGNITGIVGISRDITERKRIEDQLRYAGYHDALTGLYNRNFFERLLQRLHQQGTEKIGLLVCDIDGLKLVNDALGHVAGDRRLKRAAALLNKAIGYPKFLARIGGDEFAAIIPGATPEKLDAASKSIHRALLRYNRSSREIPLNIAVGYAMADIDHQDFCKIFKEADNAMYRDKMLHAQSNRSVIVNTVMQMLKARDFITEGHAERLQQLVGLLGERLGFSENRMDSLLLLAKFHDIGKIGIPDQVLFKPGPLNVAELAQMCRHSEIGYHIAQSIPELTAIAEWILKHHEHWDGSGYPLGLTGEQIPLECRMVLIADSYDAMTNDRPYRKALSKDYAIGQLKQFAGRQFDPVLVTEFVGLLSTR